MLNTLATDYNVLVRYNIGSNLVEVCASCNTNALAIKVKSSGLRNMHDNCLPSAQQKKNQKFDFVLHLDQS